MDKTLQDKAWRCLPKEFKEEVKRNYGFADGCRIIGNSMLEKLFGHHNLTSDAEGEDEMLCVSRKRVQDIYAQCEKIEMDDSPNLPAETIDAASTKMALLSSLFGSKCLPDETPLSQKSPENCDNGNPISNDCDKSAEPKFKRGDKVRYVGDMQPTYKGKAFVMDGEVFFNDYYNQWQTRSIKPFAWDGLSVCNVPLTDLEPYTEPEEESRNLSLSEQQEAAWNNIPSKLKEKIESKYAEYNPEAFNGFAVGYCAAIRDIFGHDRFSIIK